MTMFICTPLLIEEGIDRYSAGKGRQAGGGGHSEIVAPRLPRLQISVGRTAEGQSSINSISDTLHSLKVIIMKRATIALVLLGELQLNLTRKTSQSTPAKTQQQLRLLCRTM